MYGGSTGGWEALGVQVLYPDFYNGCFAACPDPIDFRQYTVIDIYSDRNAYFVEGPWRKIPRPGLRNYLGHVSTTIEAMNRLELVLGEKGRSGGQWDIWQAVYSPVGADGYPKPIFDKRTGVIDREVANYWREHYDIGHILQRDWAKIGPKLRGKIHIYVGEADNYYLNNAVYLVEDFLKIDEDAALRGRGRLRAARRALLERRPHAAERDLAPALRADVRAEDRRADPRHRPAGRRRQELAVLTAAARRPAACGAGRPGWAWSCSTSSAPERSQGRLSAVARSAGAVVGRGDPRGRRPDSRTGDVGSDRSSVRTCSPAADPAGSARSRTRIDRATPATSGVVAGESDCRAAAGVRRAVGCRTRC